MCKRVGILHARLEVIGFTSTQLAWNSRTGSSSDGGRHSSRNSREHNEASRLEEIVTEYIVVLEHLLDGTWGAYVPDLPGCTAGGQTAEEAFEALKMSVEL